MTTNERLRCAACGARRRRGLRYMTLDDTPVFLCQSCRVLVFAHLSMFHRIMRPVGFDVNNPPQEYAVKVEAELLRIVSEMRMNNGLMALQERGNDE